MALKDLANQLTYIVDMEPQVGSRMELTLDEWDFQQMALAELVHLQCKGLLALGALKTMEQKISVLICIC